MVPVVPSCFMTTNLGQEWPYRVRGQGFPRQTYVLAGESMTPKQREATFLKGLFVERMGTVTSVSVGRSLCWQLWNR